MNYKCTTIEIKCITRGSQLYHLEIKNDYRDFVWLLKNNFIDIFLMLFG